MTVNTLKCQILGGVDFEEQSLAYFAFYERFSYSKILVRSLHQTLCSQKYWDVRN